MSAAQTAAGIGGSSHLERIAIGYRACIIVSPVTAACVLIVPSVAGRVRGMQPWMTGRIIVVGAGTFGVTAAPHGTEAARCHLPETGD